MSKPFFIVTFVVVLLLTACSNRPKISVDEYEAEQKAAADSLATLNGQLKAVGSAFETEEKAHEATRQNLDQIQVTLGATTLRAEKAEKALADAQARLDSIEAAHSATALEQRFRSLKIKIAVYEASSGNHQTKLDSVKSRLKKAGFDVVSCKPWYLDGMTSSSPITINYGDVVNPDLVAYVQALIVAAIGGDLGVKEGYDNVVKTEDVADVRRKYGNATTVVVFPAK